MVLSMIVGSLAWVTVATLAIAAAGVAVGGASAAGAFDPSMPDPDAAKNAEKEARRKKMAETKARRGRGASIVTGGAGLAGQQDSSLGQSSLLGSG